MNTLTINRPLDLHAHFRRGEMMRKVLRYTAQHCQYGLAMPNTLPKPILTAADAISYRAEIMGEVERLGMTHFSPIMTIQIIDSTTPEMIYEAKKAGVMSGKAYPKGVTTNSHNGISNFYKLRKVFTAMEEVDMVLCLHGQKPEVFCLDREKGFHDILRWLAQDFPKLRIVMEHISIAASVELVYSLPANVVATITGHHLKLTLHDVIAHYDQRFNREGLGPHNYCQPIPQTPEDRDELIAAATSGNPKFFFGSDTAPHLRENKEHSCGCAGCFTAPIVIPMLASVFEGVGRLHMLENFTSTFGAHFYGLELSDAKIILVKEPMVIPGDYHGIVPVDAGQTYDWSITS